MKVSYQDCLYVCHYIVQHNKVEVFSSLSVKKITYVLHIKNCYTIKNCTAFAYLSTVSHRQMHLEKEQEPGVSFSPSSCPAHPSTKLLFEDSGSFVLGSALQGNKAREPKSIDAMCGCDCRMESASPWFFQVILKSINSSFSVLPTSLLLENSIAQN